MSLLADVLWECTFYYLNMGLYLSLAVGVMILLRPVTNRLLTPGQRLFLWGSVWLAGYVWTFMDLLGRLPFPISLRQLVTPRTGGFVSENLPAFLPVIREAGTYNLALPGGIAVPFQVSQGLADHLWLLAALYWLLVFAIAFWEGRQVKRLTRGARELTGEDYDRLRLNPGEKVEIRLCPALPTSFVVRGGKGHVIYLQQELPPEQMKLVLLHEREHVRQHHPWLQGIATAAWAFSFWSPLIWAGYYLFRRDMELSCDQGVLDRLDREERREYARTLVELASNRPVWGGLTTFGECDAALRVKKAAGWRPIIQDGRWFLGWLAAAVLALFLVAGAPADRVLGADILAEMDRMDIWEEADQAADWGPDTVFYADGSHGFADVYFQDLEGNWWHILYRRVPDARHGREVYVDQLPNSPSLRGYQVLDTGAE